MFNRKIKKENLEKLKDIENDYKYLRKKGEEKCIYLYQARKRAVNEIKNVEMYINTIANTPKEFAKEFEEIKIYVTDFENVIKLEDEAKQNSIKAGGSVAGGLAAGAGVAAFGPTAAMAIATTFGTASTGTAIASLSGAAATNAALAWLGGGALAAGGGIAAGNAFLALAGPIGWAIGGGALAVGGVFTAKKNKEIAEKAQNAAYEIGKQTAALRKTVSEIDKIKELTAKGNTLLLSTVNKLKKELPNDYRQFTQEQKEAIGTLVNNTKAMGQLIDKRIS